MTRVSKARQSRSERPPGDSMPYVPSKAPAMHEGGRVEMVFEVGEWGGWRRALNLLYRNAQEIRHPPNLWS